MKRQAVVQPDLNPLVDVEALPRVEEDRLTSLPGVRQGPCPGVRVDLCVDWPGVGGPVPLALHVGGRTRSPAALWWALGGPGLQ